MKSILVSPKDNEDFVLVYDFLKKMDISMSLLSDEAKEEMALGMAISEGMKTEDVPEEDIMKLLDR